MQEQFAALIATLIFLSIALYLLKQRMPWLFRLLKRMSKFLWQAIVKNLKKPETGRGAARFERE